MGVPVDFPGSNTTLGPPKGMDEISVRDLRTFTNGVHSVSCWELTGEEIREINLTGKIFLSVMSGRTQPPIYVGTEQDTRDLISDAGVWKKA